MAWAFKILVLLLSAFILYSPCQATARRMASSPAIKAGYWPSGLSTTYPPSSIDFSYFTHVLYAFVEPDSTSYELVISSDDATLLANFTSTLHAQRPPVMALLSIGGGGSNSTAFAALVSTVADRSTFIASIIEVARKYNLDGLDLDWEFNSTGPMFTSPVYTYHDPGNLWYHDHAMGLTRVNLLDAGEEDPVGGR